VTKLVIIERGMTYDKSLVVILQLVETPVGCVRGHGQTELPFINRTGIRLKESWDTECMRLGLFNSVGLGDSHELRGGGNGSVASLEWGEMNGAYGFSH
jgi:hypothetical protein